MTHVSTITLDTRHPKLIVLVQRGPKSPQPYHNPSPASRRRLNLVLGQHQPIERGGQHIYQVRQ